MFLSNWRAPESRLEMIVTALARVLGSGAARNETRVFVGGRNKAQWGKNGFGEFAERYSKRSNVRGCDGNKVWIGGMSALRFCSTAAWVWGVRICARCASAERAEGKVGEF